MSSTPKTWSTTAACKTFCVPSALSDGSVPTCQFNTTPVGNLRRQSFDEVWHGETVGRQRSWVGNCPGCWAECEVLPNAIYTGDLLKEALRPSKARRDRAVAPKDAGPVRLPVIRET